MARRHGRNYPANNTPFLVHPRTTAQTVENAPFLTDYQRAMLMHPQFVQVRAVVNELLVVLHCVSSIDRTHELEQRRDLASTYLESAIASIVRTNCLLGNDRFAARTTSGYQIEGLVASNENLRDDVARYEVCCYVLLDTITHRNSLLRANGGDPALEIDLDPFADLLPTIYHSPRTPDPDPVPVPDNDM
jgi:hypothetical protein